MEVKRNEVFGLVKTLSDAHTMGIHAASALLYDCGLRAVLAPHYVEFAVERLVSEENINTFINWLIENKITRMGFSYRLDPDNAVNLFGRLVKVLKDKGLYGNDESEIKTVFFAGLLPACERIEKEYHGSIPTFRGGESAEESLRIMGVPQDMIPKVILEGCAYDKILEKFGKSVIEQGDYLRLNSTVGDKYPKFGTFTDTLEERLENCLHVYNRPVIRAHSGPYSGLMTRQECLTEYQDWCRKLAKSGFLDVLSIGTSQLSQSSFGEVWDEKLNGGGVPVNSEKEYIDIWEAARPMLVRTYSGTKNVKKMAEMYERTINISWHALSLWWFDELDGRGPNRLYKNLAEHIDTIKYIADTNKPFEANVAHHFAFRGADDVTYIVSAYLAANMAKKCGIKSFVLQNMLNTPRSTWGIQDIAKGRTMLKLIKELEDDDFKVIYQTRAGLDYFRPNLDEAKIQLASVTAMMDDLEEKNENSPEIIHVVSYSEAICLATPEILVDSVKITLDALRKYRMLKIKGMTPDVRTPEIMNRQSKLEKSSRQIIKAMEESIPDLYSPEGLYIAFVAGWLPVPELWADSEEFAMAKNWKSRMKNGSVILSDENEEMSLERRINLCVSNQTEAFYILKHSY